MKLFAMKNAKFCPCKLCEESYGRIFTIFASNNELKLVAVEFRRILEVLRIQGLQKNFWAHSHDVCVQTQSCLL